MQLTHPLPSWRPGPLAYIDNNLSARVASAVDAMDRWLIGHSMHWFDVLSVGQCDGLMARRSVDTMARSSVGWSMRWLDDSLIGRCDGSMVRCLVDAMAQWNGWFVRRLIDAMA